MAGSKVLARDHSCVTFADGEGLAASAGSYLSEGLARGEQVGFFGWGTGEKLRDPISGLAGGDDLIKRGAVRVTSFDRHFRPDEPPDPASLLAFWSDATDGALEAGFPGLRAVAQTTPWAQLRHDHRAVFLQGEQLINRYRLVRPFALLCACDGSVLEAEALVETASIHPRTEGVATPFHLYATALNELEALGEMDALSVPLLERVLDSVPPVDPERELVIDATGLGFIDHHSLLALERHAERHGWRAVMLRNASDTARRLVDLLELRRLRAEGSR
jgi:hypothetical protein